MTVLSNTEVCVNIEHGKDSNPKYFVSAIGFNGSRHYSEDVSTYKEAKELFGVYVGVLYYLCEGGYVNIYESYNGCAKIVYSDWVI